MRDRFAASLTFCLLLGLMACGTTGTGSSDDVDATEVARRVNETVTSMTGRPGIDTGLSTPTPPTQPEPITASVVCGRGNLVGDPYDNSPAGASAAAFAEVAASPFRNIRAVTLSDDGSYARVTLCVELRRSEAAPWQDYTGAYQLANIQGRWRVQNLAVLNPVAAIDAQQRSVANSTAQARSAIAAGTATAQTVQSRPAPIRVKRTGDPSLVVDSVRRGYRPPTPTSIMFEVELENSDEGPHHGIIRFAVPVRIQINLGRMDSGTCVGYWPFSVPNGGRHLLQVSLTSRSGACPGDAERSITLDGPATASITELDGVRLAGT